MKYLKFIFLFFLISGLITSCTKTDSIDQDLSFLDGINSANHNSIFNISTDNTGLVEITPTAEGFNLASVSYGHGSGSIVDVKPGFSTTHIYPEGTYTVSIDYYDLKGNKVTKTYPLTVTYVAPENLTADFSFSGTNVSASVTADYANGMQINWGDGSSVENMTGSLGQTFTAGPHNYSAGNYTVTITALSGGAAKTVKTYDITVYNPFTLPITFEDPYQNYNVGGTFGGVNIDHVPNPIPDGINTSATVRKYEKTVGAETWSGTWTPLSEPNGVPIDMNNGNKIKVMVYASDFATEAGNILNLELEQASGGLANQILKMPIPESNKWVEITYDFGAAGVPAGTTFKQMVFRYNDNLSGFGEVLYLDNIRQSD